MPSPKSATPRSEFIPLGYDSFGRVIDVCGNFRKVEAIPYGLGLVELRTEDLTDTFEEVNKVRMHFRSLADKGGAKDRLEQDLTGRLGYIAEVTEDTISWDDGRNLAVQLYRLLD